MVMNIPKKMTRLTPDKTVFFECDIQKVLAKHIYRNDTMAHNAMRFTKLSEILKIPIISTAQKNFGDVDDRITAVHHDLRQTFTDKTSFSMLDSRVNPVFTMMMRPSVVIYGCETQICVKQTVLDLLERDFKVHVVVDAVSSMQIQDRNVGL